MTNLPEGITTRDFADDIILTGPNLTASIFNDIKLTLQPEDRQNVIGWIRTGR